jgi:hypothetical protein
VIGAEIERLLRQLIREEMRAALAEVADGRSGGARYVSVKTYAEARSISPSTVRQAMRDGRLEPMRVGRSVRVQADAEIASRSTKLDNATDRAEQRLGLVRGGKP